MLAWYWLLQVWPASRQSRPEQVRGYQPQTVLLDLLLLLTWQAMEQHRQRERVDHQAWSLDSLAEEELSEVPELP